MALAIEGAIGELRSGQLADPDRAAQRLFGVKYAATRADVVGHSMGGVLTRLYISDASAASIVRGGGYADAQVARSDAIATGSVFYLRPDNYGAGSIRRFVSVGTPFDGSNWGSLGSVVDRGKFYATTFKAVWRSSRGEPVDQIPMPLDAAVRDLAPASALQVAMDDANYPTLGKRVRWKPVVGIASESINPTTKQALKWSLMKFGASKIPNAGEADPNAGDLVVLADSQCNGQPDHARVFLNTVHSSDPLLQLRPGIKNEPTSPYIRSYIEEILYSRRVGEWQGVLK